MPFWKSKPVIHGTVAPGFEPVRELFAENFRRGLEEDAQCCAYVGEEKVVVVQYIQSTSVLCVCS